MPATSPTNTNITSMATLYDELQATYRLIDDQRQTLYLLQDRLNEPHEENLEQLIRDRLIIIKGLETYRGYLESVYPTLARREKNPSYNGKEPNN